MALRPGAANVLALISSRYEIFVCSKQKGDKIEFRKRKKFGLSGTATIDEKPISTCDSRRIYFSCRFGQRGPGCGRPLLLRGRGLRWMVWC